MVGLGFGRAILEKIRSESSASDHFNLSAVCDLEPARVRELSQKYGVAGYHSLDELLEKDSSPVIGLFTAPLRRAQLLRKIIRAGRDVMTTKPFELDPGEAHSVLEEARSLGRVIHLNSPAPSLPRDLQLVDDWRMKHRLGRPVGGSARVWVSYHEKRDGTWLDDPQTCPGGPLFRLGIYLFNDFSHIFGAAEQLQLMTSRLRTGRPTPDTAQVGIRYRNGSMAQVFASFCVEDGDQFQNAMVLNFERGTIYRNVGAHRQCVGESKAEISLVRLGENGRQVVEHEEIEEISGNYQWGNLASAVRTRDLGSDDSIFRIVEGIRLVDALRRAQETGSTLV